MIERLADYHHKLLILRQIMSNKARRYRAINVAANLGTVVVSSFLTFMGFTGVEKVTTYAGWIDGATAEAVELVFNLLILSLFILVVLHLVFRFGTAQATAERAVVTLTHLINQIDDKIEFAVAGIVIEPATVELIREKYDTLIQTLPANSDREFIRAKRDFKKKLLKKATLAPTAQDLFDEAEHERILKAVVRQSERLMGILEAIRSVDSQLHLGGGLTRNAVWDFLHGYRRETPMEDADVVYFDRLGDRPEHDEIMEARLREQIPNIRWSVKNQARMHLANNEDAYASLEEAIEKWPETATAFLVRLGEDGELHVLAPHRLTDLFRLVVRPTPHFRGKLARYRERVAAKRWRETWPKLVMLDVDP